VITASDLKEWKGKGQFRFWDEKVRELDNSHPNAA